MDYKYFLICLGVCFLLSFLIGIERQYRRRIIGLRTTILVSIGSFLFVSMSFYVSNPDTTRIAAQVVSGIGFLGAGVIIKDGLKVRGLTTAATLWCDAAVGVLCACGALMHAIAGTIVILFANIVLRYVNRLVNEKSHNKRAIEVYNINITSNGEIKDIKDIINKFIIKYNRADINIQDIEIINNKSDRIINVTLDIRKVYNVFIDKLISLISDNKDVINIKCTKLKEEENEEEEL